MLDRIEFILGEAFISLRRNLLMTLAAVSTMAMALLLLGGMRHAFSAINQALEGQTADYRLRVFLAEGTTTEQRQEVDKKLRAIQGVESVQFISKEQGLKDFQRENPGISLDDLSGYNPLPDAFDVKPADLKDSRRIEKEIRKFSYLDPKDPVQNADEVRNILEELRSGVRLLGLLLSSLMLATGGIIIYNAIRLTILARRREMRIMQLVGATRMTVWAPLLMEGIIQGALGGFISAALLWLTVEMVNGAILNFASQAHVEGLPFLTACIWQMLAGATFGLICSTFAVREPRKES